MAFSLHDLVIPATNQILGSISAILDKAAQHCEEKKINPSVLVNYRLAADMLPLSSQIQIMSDQAKGMMARLTGVEAPRFEDNETTFPELKARIAKTLDFVNGFKRDQLDGSENREVVLKFPEAFNVPGNQLTLRGGAYTVHFFLANFYFHATTAHDILRHAGVPIGKRDFLGKFF